MMTSAVVSAAPAALGSSAPDFPLGASAAVSAAAAVVALDTPTPASRLAMTSANHLDCEDRLTIETSLDTFISVAFRSHVGT
jgi:hypothetical protein